jgi:hypothetical protein
LVLFGSHKYDPFKPEPAQPTCKMPSEFHCSLHARTRASVSVSVCPSPRSRAQAIVPYMTTEAAIQAMLAGRPPVEEGIVPGLDFCNHSDASAARWDVVGDGGQVKVRHLHRPVYASIPAPMAAGMEPGSNCSRFGHAQLCNSGILSCAH